LGGGANNFRPVADFFNEQKQTTPAPSIYFS